MEGLTGLCNDAAHWSVRTDAIFAEFREGGHATVRSLSDVRELKLEQVDKVVGWLSAKYKGIAAVEGAAADTSSQRERLFALNTLGMASSPTDASKAAAMAQLVRLAQDVAKNVTWKELEKSAFVKIIQAIAKALGIRLTKAKLAQAIPVFGAAVGGGFNAYFTANVCDTAYHVYRERFLAAKYGAQIFEQTFEAEADFDAAYPELAEDIETK